MNSIRFELAKKSFVLMVVLFWTITVFAQSPWVYPKEKGFYQIQSTFLVSPYSTLVMGQPTEERVELNREVYTADFSFYFEHGLTDRLNIIGKLPFRYVSTGEETSQVLDGQLLEEGSISGLSNLEFAVKYQLVDKSVKVASSVRTILNTVSKKLEKGLITGYEYNAIGLFGHVGTGIGDRSYAFTDLGFVMTSNDYSDYFQQHVEGGYRFGRALWVRLTLDIKKSIKNGNYDDATLLQTGLNPNDQEWIGFGVGISYETKKQLGFNLSTGGALDAQYIGLSAPITVGFYKKI